MPGHPRSRIERVRIRTGFFGRLILEVLQKSRDGTIKWRKARSDESFFVDLEIRD